LKRLGEYEETKSMGSSLNGFPASSQIRILDSKLLYLSLDGFETSGFLYKGASPDKILVVSNAFIFSL